ncbi:MAG: hypothetical protein DLM64_05835 [Solirubrobacterales bacterium]|nr:MAG: hypothetical protein DLM64_05835 [Solirubrobacterales bacterium]
MPMDSDARPRTNVLHNLALPERYEVVRHIASGGMASVWCAHDRLLDRAVAIKLLADQFAHDEQAVKRFKREARAAARLSEHPHVVTIYDVGDAVATGAGRGGDADHAGDRAFIVMEYLPGGTVADALKAGPVARKQALRWIGHAAAALDYAHRLGVIHRDIKPANFLLDRERGLHVADFGIARLGGEGTITGSGELFGTSAYLSPEQALGRRATGASDRYSLAVAAYELLAGERPFTAEHFAAQARAHIEQPVPAASGRNPALPRALDGVLARGLAKRPEDRWPTAGAFVDALEQALDQTEATALQPVPPGGARAGTRSMPAARVPAPSASGTRAASRVTRSPRRALLLGGLGALVVAALAAALATGAFQSGKSKPTTASSAHRPRATPRAVPASRSGSSTAASTPAVSTASTVATPASTPAAPADAGALEARGHQLLAAGDYATAIPVLRQAVAAAPPASVTYAYALYDLGRSLLLSGDPQGAVAVLQQRLRIPNQTDTVRQTLAAAQRAAAGSQGHGHK